MKLNHECVRDLLLYLESHLELNDYYDLAKSELLETSNFDKEVIYYTAMKLIEAGYIDGKPSYASNVLLRFPISSITWEGHKFLDNIRDDGVWRETKGIISKFTSVSVSMLENISSQVITSIISKQLGLN